MGVVVFLCIGVGDECIMLFIVGCLLLFSVCFILGIGDVLMVVRCL